jgi:hypothetical protein
MSCGIRFCPFQLPHEPRCRPQIHVGPTPARLAGLMPPATPSAFGCDSPEQKHRRLSSISCAGCSANPAEPAFKKEPASFIYPTSDKKQVNRVNNQIHALWSMSSCTWTPDCQISGKHPYPFLRPIIPEGPSLRLQTPVRGSAHPDGSDRARRVPHFDLPPPCISSRKLRMRLATALPSAFLGRGTNVVSRGSFSTSSFSSRARRMWPRASNFSARGPW